MSRVRIPSFAHVFRGRLNILQALILGLIQGVTEFFPVSSSAHLRLARWLLGISEADSFLYFDLACHAGTVLALLIYLRRELKIFRSAQAIPYFALALIPLVPAYFLFKPLREAFSQPYYLGYFLMLTALLLFVASRRPLALAKAGSGTNTNSEAGGVGGKYRDVLFIGVMQTLALIPGISRSASTITAARMRGWEWKEAVRFSFLLSIPAVLGGELLETVKLIKHGPPPVELIPLAVGFAASFGMGWIAVRCIFWVYEKEKVRPFAWYCLGVGLIAAMFYGQTAA